MTRTTPLGRRHRGTGRRARLTTLLALAGLVCVGLGGTAPGATAAPTRATASAPVTKPAAGTRTLEVRGTPANPTPRVVTQPDGSTITLQNRGDAGRHWVSTPDGHSVTRGADGWYRYATGRDARGNLAAGAARVGRAPAPAASLGLAPTADTAGSVTLQGPARPTLGKQPTIILLARFTNVAGTTTPAQWSNRFFSTGHGTVRDFYSVASASKMTITPAAETSGTAGDGVVGWLDLGIPHPDFAGGLTSPAENDLTARALAKADPFVNFASYDKNRDGVLDSWELHIVVIAAGYESSFVSAGSSPCGPDIWGHMSALQSPVRLDGQWIGGGGYTQFGELHCDTDSGPATMATLGIMVHELGHDLGWPDLYDLSYEGNPLMRSTGVGRWSIMGYGSWAGTPPGANPILPDAWSRYQQGWIEPTPATASGLAVTLSPAGAPSGTQAARMLQNPNGTDWSFHEYPQVSATGEYFLVENRQQSGYDADLPGCGLVVYHVDETRQNNDTDARRLVDVEEAGGPTMDGPDTASASFGRSTDTWKTGQQFTGTSTPGTRLYSGAATDAALTVTNAGCGITDATATVRGTSTPTPSGSFHPVFPTRLLDTRSGSPRGPNSLTTVQVTDRAGIPTTGVSAVVVNVTAITPTANTIVTAFPQGGAVPSVSNLNPTKGVPAVAGLAVVKVPANGQISLWNSTGSVHFAVDVVGWYAAVGGAVGSRFDPTTPYRALDTRSSTPIGPRETRHLQLAGVGPVPTDATGVIVNLTVTQPTTASWLTAWPRGGTAPTASNVNFVAGQTIANLAYSPLSGGAISLRNAVGSAHVIVDVVGWFGPGGRYTYHPIAPTRVVDTRVGRGVARTAPVGTVAWIDPTGYDVKSVKSPVPDNAAALVATVTATGTTATSYFTVHAYDAIKPNASNLNWTAGTTVPNLMTTALGPNGWLYVHNAAGQAHLIVDVVGWFAP